MGSMMSVPSPPKEEPITKKKKIQPLQEKEEKEPDTTKLAWLEDYWKFV
jgi:hypothetical protein